MNSLPLFTKMIVRKIAKTKSTRPIRRLHLAARQKTSEAEAGGVQAIVEVIDILPCLCGKRIMHRKGGLSDKGELLAW